MARTTLPLRLRAGLATGVLVAAAVVVVGWSQPAAAAGPTLTGGQVAAPYNGVATHPAVASNGSKALTVWHERVGSTNWGIYGRISSAKTDTIGPRFTIAYTEGHPSMYPDVAWSGSNWLVVWQYAYSGTDEDIHGSVVSTSGSAGSSFLVEGNTSNQFWPSVTGGKDGEWFVAWEDHRNQSTTLSDIYGRRITPAGTVDTAFPHYRLSYDLQGIQTEDTVPDITYNKNIDIFSFVYLVAGSGRSRIRYRDFDRTTLFTGEYFIDHDSAHPVSDPRIVSNGTDLLIVYVDNKAPGLDLSGYVLGADVDAHGFAITTSSTGNETEPTVAYNGNFMVAWKDTRNDTGGDIYATRLKTDGTGLDGNGFLVTNYSPQDEYPALGKGTNKAGTFTAAWNLTPSGQGTGIALYGIDYPAPK